MLTSLHEGGDVRDHVNQFFVTLGKLKAMGIDSHSDILTIRLLYSLPKRYENFRCAIESRDELPLVDKLGVKILEESEARKKSTNVNENTETFVASNIKNIRRPNKIRCFECNRIGQVLSV